MPAKTRKKASKIATATKKSLTTPAERQYLKSVYEDASSPGSYAGVQNLYNVVKNDKNYPGQPTRRKVQEFLHAMLSYSLHKRARKRFPRRRIIARRINDVWYSDLAAVSNLSPRLNSGVQWWLVVVDSLHTYLRVEPLRTKSSLNVLEGLKKIVQKAGGRFPRIFISDSG